MRIRTTSLYDELRRFEALRVVLGHAAVIATSNIMTIITSVLKEADHTNWGYVDEPLLEKILIGYARVLRERQKERTYEGIVPVLPMIDLASLTVSHQTCGASFYKLDPTSSCMLFGYRDDDAPEYGGIGWHAARALLGRSKWSGGGGPLALSLAVSEMYKLGVDEFVIHMAAAEGFFQQSSKDEELRRRLEVEAVTPTGEDVQDG